MLWHSVRLCFDVSCVYEFCRFPDAWLRVPDGVVIGAALLPGADGRPGGRATGRPAASAGLSFRPGRSAAHVWALLVVVDAYDVLWLVAEGPRCDLVRWCLDRALRVYPTLGLMADALRGGLCVGVLPELAGFVGVSLAVAPAAVEA
jgi:hypothetical protein